MRRRASALRALVLVVPASLAAVPALAESAAIGQPGVRPHGRDRQPALLHAGGAAAFNEAARSWSPRCRDLADADPAVVGDAVDFVLRRSAPRTPAATRPTRSTTTN